MLHLGSRPAVDQALSRLARSGDLLRASRGVYVLPIQGRFGARSPAVSKVVQEWATQRGETVVGHGASAANTLGLTTQVPVRQIFLTSGRSRKLKLGTQMIELRHAAPWQLIFPGQAAGDVIRSLAWLGPSGSEAALGKLRRKFPASELQEVANARPPAKLAGGPRPRLSTLADDYRRMVDDGLLLDDDEGFDELLNEQRQMRLPGASRGAQGVPARCCALGHPAGANGQGREGVSLATDTRAPRVRGRGGQMCLPRPHGREPDTLRTFIDQRVRSGLYGYAQEGGVALVELFA